MGTDEGTNSDSDHATDPDETASSSTTGSAGTVASNARRSTDGSSREGGAGEAIGRSLDSARDTLAQPGPKSHLTFVIGLFGIIGVGFGLTGVIAIELIAGGGNAAGGGAFAGLAFLLTLLVVVLFIGPVIGAFGGLRVAERLDDSRATYLTSFVSTAVGYVVMVIVAMLLVGIVVGGGGGGTTTGGGTNLFSVVDLLVPLIALAVPVGLTGLGSSFLVRWNASR